MRYLLLAFVVAFTTSISAEEYVGVFWNVHSGNSNADTIGNQMAAKGDVDFWGLSEVPDQAFLSQLVTKISAATGANYVSQLSVSGDNSDDHLAIIFNADRLTLIPYSGSHPVSKLNDTSGTSTEFFEVTTVQVTPGLRASLGCQLQGENGERVVVLVNHWKAFSSGQDKRKLQAEATDVFAAQTQNIPIIVAGDHNIPIKNQGTGTQQEAFQIMESQFDYLVPTNGPNVGTFRSGSVLDSVFLANDLATVDSSVTILNRDGNQPATSRSFTDSSSESDHRPISIHIEADADSQIEALEEDIAVIESVLQQMKQSLAELKAARQ